MPQRDTSPPPELRPLGATMLVLIHFSAYMTVVWIGLALARGKLISVLYLAAAAVVGVLVALYVGLNRYAPTTKTAAALLLRAPRGRQLAAIPLAAVVGAALAPLAAEVSVRVVRAWPLAKLPPEVEEELAGQGGGQVGVWTALVAASVLLAPFVEEALFRGFIQPRLARSVGAARAFAVTLGLYVAAQVNPRFMPAALILAAAMGVVALRSGTTWAAVAGHVAHQIAPYAFLWGGRELPNFGDASPRLMPPAVVVGWAAAAAVALLLLWTVGGPAPATEE